MLIKEIFQRDITRSINGVIKADQLDEASIWQELDEYVVTAELKRHIDRFITAYLNVIHHPRDPAVTDRIGVWISGYFGSGKSHFIKILSYLLENRTISKNGSTLRAVDVFATKIADPLLFANIKKAVASHTEVVLFNVDSKADPSQGIARLLKVFMRVFNESCGFSGDYPHVAHMERHLAREGKLQEFRDSFRDQAGDSWEALRDAYDFHHDQVTVALGESLGLTPEASRRWLDNAEANFPLTPENFARWVKEYLDSRGPNHRLVFFADEIGQFIGTDTKLMLNLQSITEELGTQCKGRAWIVVTSQEDMDKVLGDINATRSNDFSKITARFATRLSLSSVHADEVIRGRLLTKTTDANAELASVYAANGSLLRNQTVFTDVLLKFKKLDSVETFQSSYPFLPYQFLLVQKVFDQIRQHGATGRHLSSGERSLLDAFKDATVKAACEKVGVLVPLYNFYPSIESFLDTAVKRTIDGANDGTLPPFDIEVLRVLFLVRYVEEFRATLDNLTTLCTDEIDVDRIALRAKIEESVVRLESLSLIRRNGDDYFFLNNEERDIDREIKDVEVTFSEQSRQLGKLIFENVLKDNNKYRYPLNKKDFGFDRWCDGYIVGKTLAANDLRVDIVSPLHDNYEQYDPSFCIMQAADRLLIKLGSDRLLYREIETWLKTDRYIKRKSDAAAPPATKRILSDRADDNRQREERLTRLVSEQFVAGEFYAAAQSRTVKAASAAAVLAELLTYLIDNTFSKLRYLKAIKESPDQCRAEISAVLSADDVGQQALELSAENINAQAYDDVRAYIKLMTVSKHSIVLKDLIERYEKRPYGWAEFETALVVARLFIVGEISLVHQGDTVNRSAAAELLTKQSKWGTVTIIKRKMVDTKHLERARLLGLKLFFESGPDSEEPLVDFWRKRLQAWKDGLAIYQTLAATGRYPGNGDIVRCLHAIKAALSVHNSFEFIEHVLAHEVDLDDAADRYRDLSHFYDNQRLAWEALLNGLEKFAANRGELMKDADAAAALAEMEVIRKAPAPYSKIMNIDGLLKRVNAVNDLLIAERRKHVIDRIRAAVAQVEAELTRIGSNDELSHRCLRPLQELQRQVESETRLGNLLMLANSVGETVDRSMDMIEKEVVRREKERIDKLPPKPDPTPPPPPPKPRRIIKPVSVMTKPYLETKADVDEFLMALEIQLEAAIAANERIRIE